MLFVANSTPSSYYVHSISKAHVETSVARFMTWIDLITSPDQFSFKFLLTRDQPKLPFSSERKQ